MDLTKITTPFGLLDEQTQFSLRMHEGPIEYFSSIGMWMTCQSRPGWSSHTAYRVKSQPPKPREWWINVYVDKAGDLNAGQLHFTRSKADALGNLRLECIHVREVLE